MKVFLFTVLTATLSNFSSAQNLGVGTTTPTEKLDVNGNTRSERVIISSGGSVADGLSKLNNTGEVGFKKGHRGFGLRYIICAQGVFPSSNGPSAQNAPAGEVSFIGQLKIMAGNVVPKGWFLCNGQFLPRNQNIPLFSLIGYTYGGSEN